MVEETATFEEHLKQLELLVAKLERGEVGMEEALLAFEQGMQLVEVCKKKLEMAEIKVEKLVKRDG